jgi:hypothetical protein
MGFKKSLISLSSEILGVVNKLCLLNFSIILIEDALVIFKLITRKLYIYIYICYSDETTKQTRGQKRIHESEHLFLVVFPVSSAKR